MPAPTPLSKIILPIDGSDPCRRAVTFTGCLAAGIGAKVKEIALLHVLAGGYLSEHLANVDFRAADIVATEQFHQLRQRHIEATVTPMFEAARQELTRLGAQAAITERVTEGVPAREIARIASEENFSTIIICRRGLSQAKEFFLGSVTASLLHRVQHPTIYVVGSRLTEASACLLPRIMIMVDGSSHALAAVREAAVLASTYGEALEKIILLHVINLATMAPKQEQGRNTADEAAAILDEADAILTSTGVPKEKVQPTALYGDPVEAAMDLIEREDVNLVMLGRRGRSAIEDMLIGGVSNTILHRCHAPTIGVVCSSKQP